MEAVEAAAAATPEEMEVGAILGLTVMIAASLGIGALCFHRRWHRTQAKTSTDGEAALSDEEFRRRAVREQKVTCVLWVIFVLSFALYWVIFGCRDGACQSGTERDGNP